MNKEYYDYLKSKEWLEIKLNLYAVRGRKCERCGDEKNIQVHHKTYENIFKEKPDDLEILCGNCHRMEHGLIKRKRKKVDLSKLSKKELKKYHNDQQLRKANRDRYIAFKNGLLPVIVPPELCNTLFGDK